MALVVLAHDDPAVPADSGDALITGDDARRVG